MPNQWLPIGEAAKILNISERTLRRRIEEGKYESRMEGRRRLILVDVDSVASQTPSDAYMEHLIEENKELKDQAQQLQEELSIVRQRSDTIILQLTNQNQALLEYKNEPWYRRWFSRD